MTDKVIKAPTALVEQQDSVVRMIEGCLKEAKAGKYRSIVIFADHKESTGYTTFTSQPVDARRVIGRLQEVAFDLLCDLGRVVRE